MGYNHLKFVFQVSQQCLVPLELKTTLVIHYVIISEMETGCHLTLLNDYWYIQEPNM